MTLLFDRAEFRETAFRQFCERDASAVNVAFIHHSELRKVADFIVDCNRLKPSRLACFKKHLEISRVVGKATIADRAGRDGKPSLVQICNAIIFCNFAVYEWIVEQRIFRNVQLLYASPLVISEANPFVNNLVTDACAFSRNAHVCVHPAAQEPIHRRGFAPLRAFQHHLSDFTSFPVFCEKSRKVETGQTLTFGVQNPLIKVHICPEKWYASLFASLFHRVRMHIRHWVLHPRIGACNDERRGRHNVPIQNHPKHCFRRRAARIVHLNQFRRLREVRQQLTANFLQKFLGWLCFFRFFVC